MKNSVVEVVIKVSKHIDRSGNYLIFHFTLNCFGVSRGWSGLPTNSWASSSKRGRGGAEERKERKEGGKRWRETGRLAGFQCGKLCAPELGALQTSKPRGIVSHSLH